MLLAVDTNVLLVDTDVLLDQAVGEVDVQLRERSGNVRFIVTPTGLTNSRGRLMRVCAVLVTRINSHAVRDCLKERRRQERSVASAKHELNRKKPESYTDAFAIFRRRNACVEPTATIRPTIGSKALTSGIAGISAEMANGITPPPVATAME